jgi:gliding motility-associated-like protein
LQICASGTYTVTFTDNIGCTVSGTKTFIDDVVPVASFTSTPPSPVAPGQPISFGSTSTITPGTIVSATWSFGDGGTASGDNVSYAYPNAGTFPVILTVTASNGCVDTALVNYDVNAVLEIPNVITPNNDNANEFLKFANLQVFGDNTLFIYNRWGKKIFEQSNYKNDWNGAGQSDGTISLF